MYIVLPYWYQGVFIYVPSTFCTFQQKLSPTKLPVASYGCKFLSNICPGRQSGHDQTANTARFFMEAQPLCQPVGSAIQPKCPNKG